MAAPNLYGEQEIILESTYTYMLGTGLNCPSNSQRDSLTLYHQFFFLDWLEFMCANYKNPRLKKKQFHYHSF